MTSHALAGIRTLLFDTMGTVVDDEGTLRRTLQDVLGDGPGRDADGLTTEVNDRVNAAMAEINSGAQQWRSHREIRHEVLEGLLRDGTLPGLTADAFEALATVIARLDPWPDSVAALTALRTKVAVVALSNADLAELTALSLHSGLSWHAVVSAEFAHRYKPHPAVYRTALELVGADPAQTLMVAAHPWDLRAAAEHGMATAYVARPGAVRPDAADSFTVYVDDLAELDRLLDQ